MSSVDSSQPTDWASGQPGAAPGAAEDRSMAWEMIAAGRYQPRRTRGSFPGRELG